MPHASSLCFYILGLKPRQGWFSVFNSNTVKVKLKIQTDFLACKIGTMPPNVVGWNQTRLL
jgi:hypothetical protein